MARGLPCRCRIRVAWLSARLFVAWARDAATRLVGGATNRVHNRRCRGLRQYFPIQFLNQLVEQRAVPALQRHTLTPNASKKRAALRRVEGQKPPLRNLVGSLRVLFHKRFRVRRDELPALLIGRQAHSRDQQEPLLLLLLVHHVAVAIPSRGPLRGFRFS